MRKNPDKPFKTFPELVKYLQEKHRLHIIDPLWAEKALRIIPYYDLVNGYKDVFMSNDEFRDSICFEYLYLFHAFDHQLQNILFEFSIVIENYFKNNLSFILAKDFGVFESDYLSRKNYVSAKNNLKYDALYHSIKSIFWDTKHNSLKPRHKIDEPTAHYVYTHNHIPPWILLKNVSFSNAINLYILMKPEQKIELTNIIIPNPLINVSNKIQLLEYALTLIRKCRNSIAHNLKFISFNNKKYYNDISNKSLKAFIPPELLSWTDIHQHLGKYDIYAYIIFSMALLPDSIQKNSLLTNLLILLDRYSQSSDTVELSIFSNYCHYTHLPLNICDRLHRYNEQVLNSKHLFPEMKQ